MLTPPLTILTEQVNSLPFLLGVMHDMDLPTILDTHMRPHGNWAGASVGTVLTIWLSHILQERDHRLVSVRDWVADRTHTLQTLLDISLRPTECSDDRLAILLTLLGDPATQVALDAALLQRWIRVYQLPTQTVCLDSTSVSVYHNPDEDTSLLHYGFSKDHRPDLRQFKVMLASLDPLGLPIGCQAVAGHHADNPLYVPAYEAAITALGTTDVLVVGDSKMGDLSTRGHLVSKGSRYLCAYRPARATDERAAWVTDALAHATQWTVMDAVDPQNGEITPTSVIYALEREQTWQHPSTKTQHAWQERVLVVRSTPYHTGQQRLREQALERLTTRLWALMQPPTRGRKRYRTEAALRTVVQQAVQAAQLDGIVQVALTCSSSPSGQAAWVVGAVWVDGAAWQAMVERLGWQVYVSNTTPAEYAAQALVASYHQQPVQERGFSRLKTRNLALRPVWLRDETRISGLVWLLCLALRILVLTEQRVRQALEVTQTKLVGLNPANPTQGTAQPTTERMIRAFRNMTVTIIRTDTATYHHMTPLNALQQHILQLLGLSADVYTRLSDPVANSPPEMPES